MHCVDLGESFPTSIYLQNLASIQPRTSPVKFPLRGTDAASSSFSGSSLGRTCARGWPEMVGNCLTCCETGTQQITTQVLTFAGYQHSKRWDFSFLPLVPTLTSISSWSLPVQFQNISYVQPRNRINIRIKMELNSDEAHEQENPSSVQSWLVSSPKFSW